MSNPSRRAVIVGGLASTTGLASASQASANEPETKQVLAGTGTGSSTYEPPLTSVDQKVTLHSDTAFVPALACASNPPLALTSDSVNGTIRSACTGSLSSPNLNGVLKWSDGSTSSYSVDSVTGERFNGHLMLHAIGTIKNGHYNGARVDRFESRLSDDVSSPCLTGEPVTGTTGSVVIAVTLP